jgi:hypothetical protein
MGQSTNAVVFYGYCWDDEDAEFGTDMDETVKAILAERGYSDPWEARPESIDYRAYMAANQAEFDDYRTAEDAVRVELGVDWGTHCHHECSMPYLFVRDTDTTAHRGFPRPLTSLDVDPAWKGKLDAFLVSQDIEPPEGENQPGWWVASWWG